MPILRYPGGKRKLRAPILAAIHEHLDGTQIAEFSEPFLGGGEISLSVLRAFSQITKIHVNDKDVALASLWTSVIRYPDDLAQLIRDFVPERKEFFRFKQALELVTQFQDNRSIILDYGFKKLALHQTSFSGLGEMAGGPMTEIDSRWSTNHRIKEINAAHRLFNQVEVVDNRCTTLDFADVIEASAKGMIYLDPPYFEKGSELYKHAFTEQDHIRLAKMLKESPHWVLSYDDHPVIRDLYQGWADIRQIDVKYSINGSFKKPELLIVPHVKTNFAFSLPTGMSLVGSVMNAI
jgi:DNA adenine methylase